ncbi:hypothetical protein [Hymenobacter cheonanensis]|uniref:hypothetical protein n=1 Tax=Hymenobacter sp. CA2-7 TaxID=3063993 RepID=UPI002712E096|nr:hypothetical protein [Hymenobacter sp. CA2-7]MDO7884292.1 hypothetical protein [Hymenobacter sp. CA2-7]
MKRLLLALPLLTVAFSSHSQTAQPTAYEFLTVVEHETQYYKRAKIVFAPAFQGKSELGLESLPSSNSEKFPITLGKNLEVVNSQLEALTVAGWELVHVSSEAVSSSHEYLFRRRKP